MDSLKELKDTIWNQYETLSNYSNKSGLNYIALVQTLADKNPSITVVNQLVMDFKISDTDVVKIWKNIGDYPRQPWSRKK